MPTHEPAPGYSRTYGLPRTVLGRPLLPRIDALKLAIQCALVSCNVPLTVFYVRRQRNILYWRNMAIYFGWHQLRLSQHQLAHHFTRERTTMHHAVQVTKRRLVEDPSYALQYDAYRQAVLDHWNNGTTP